MNAVAVFREVWMNGETCIDRRDRHAHTRCPIPADRLTMSGGGLRQQSDIAGQVKHTFGHSRGKQRNRWVGRLCHRDEQHPRKILRDVDGHALR